MDVDGEAYRADKEDGAVLEVDSENERAAPALQDDEIDPLDAFMNSTMPPEVEKLANNNSWGGFRLGLWGHWE
ncbi:hypothetical protein ACFX2F_024043 [Malus domestica]